MQAGISPLLQQQFEELARQKHADVGKTGDIKKRKLVVIGQDCVEPLQALRSSGQEVILISHLSFAFNNFLPAAD